MAGTALPTIIAHRSRGVVRTDATITCDASGVATASVVGVGFGRLVGVLYNGGLDVSAVISVTDTKTGGPIVTYTTGTEGTAVRFRPTKVITDNAGVAVAAAASAPNVNRDIYVGGKVSIGVTGGGVSETCILSLIVDEEGLGELATTV
jgi:hypothetical protein